MEQKVVTQSGCYLHSLLLLTLRSDQQYSFSTDCSAHTLVLHFLAVWIAQCTVVALSMEPSFSLTGKAAPSGLTDLLGSSTFVRMLSACMLGGLRHYYALHAFKSHARNGVAMFSGVSSRSACVRIMRATEVCRVVVVGE